MFEKTRKTPAYFADIYLSNYGKPARILFLLMVSAMLLSAVFAFEAVEPQISHVSGFYPEDFELILTAPAGQDIYYTLDGSEPGVHAIRYTGPIHISNQSREPNAHSMRTDVSAGFYTDLIQKYETLDGDYGYRSPDYLLDKCTIIRAVSVNWAGIPSKEISMSYFVGIPPETYHGCRILSLVTAPDSLFDAEEGIYVTGNTFDAYLQSEHIGQHWRFWDANYRQRGKEWERKAVFHFFDADGTLVLNKTGGMRIHGGVSRAALPRGLNLYARAEYDHSDFFEADFFGSGFFPHSLTLNSGGNQLITQFNDYMMTERVRERNYATQLFEPYVLFLNGEYWGFYWMSEKYDETYLKYYYDVDESNCVMIKNGSLEVGEDSDYRLYEQMLSFISDHDMTIENNYEKACEMIDIDSFLDYYATMYYIARTEDWPGGNWAIWRSRAHGNSPYADTKWRWMLFDCNSSCMSTYPDWDMTDYDTLPEICSYAPIFASLWENSSFRTEFCNRVFEISEECFDAEEMEIFIQQYLMEMEPILEKSWKRFYGSQNEKKTEYTQILTQIQNFFANRRKYVDSWLSAYLQ